MASLADAKAVAVRLLAIGEAMERDPHAVPAMLLEVAVLAESALQSGPFPEPFFDSIYGAFSAGVEWCATRNDADRWGLTDLGWSKAP